jgi:hypothetical protein
MLNSLRMAKVFSRPLLSETPLRTKNMRNDLKQNLAPFAFKKHFEKKNFHKKNNTSSFVALPN